MPVSLQLYDKYTRNCEEILTKIRLSTSLSSYKYNKNNTKFVKRNHIGDCSYLQLLKLEVMRTMGSMSSENSMGTVGTREMGINLY